MRAMARACSSAGRECVGVNGTGTFNQSGGTNAIVGGGDFSGVISVDAYDSSRGVLLLGYNSNSTKYSGGNGNGYYGNGVGTYNLNSGLLTGDPTSTSTISGIEVVGVCGTGTFNQSGGTNCANGGLWVGGSTVGGLGLQTAGGSAPTPSVMDC